MLATVTAGLYISWNGLRLISADTRLQGIFFWDFFIYLTEGMVFLMTGLQARASDGRLPFVLEVRLGRLRRDRLRSSSSLRDLSGCIPRPICLGGSPAPSHGWIRHRPWQWPFALAFTGIRGMVSLAAALAIPLETERAAVSPPRSDSDSDLCGHLGDAGGPGSSAAYGDSRTGLGQCRVALEHETERARGICSASQGHRCGDEASRGAQSGALAPPLKSSNRCRAGTRIG